jgi:hypothetical protein
MVNDSISTPTSATNTLSKENLLKLISTKDASVTFSKENKKSHTSKVWLNFSSILVGNMKQDYVTYDSGMSAIVYKPATDTGDMQKHIESCPKKPLLLNELNETMT